MAGNWVFALSLGERVSRYRRFHQPERDGRGVSCTLRRDQMGEDDEVTPHPARSARHPLPKGEGCISDFGVAQTLPFMSAPPTFSLDCSGAPT